MTAKKRNLGWLGPAIVLLGAAVAAVGVWAMVSLKPKQGDVIDTVDIDRGQQLVIRNEADGGDRNFVDLVENGEIKWSAMVPTYGGRKGAPGLAWSGQTISVRVIRDGRAEIFALIRNSAAKLGGFKLAPGKGAVTLQTTGPVTLPDPEHERSFELVEGPGWHQVVAIDLATGKGVWSRDLSGDPIEDAGISVDAVWVRQKAARRQFELADGSERATAARSSN